MKALLFVFPLLGCVDAGPKLLPDGTTGTERVFGMKMSWVVINGEKLVSDDLSLGPAVEKPSLYAVGNPDNWSVWDQGTVTYCIHPSLGMDPCIVRQALADLSVDGGIEVDGCKVSTTRGETPMHFQERTCAELEGTWGYLDFEVGDTPSGRAGTVFNYHGMTITFPPNPNDPKLAGFNQATVLHETGHALGLTHEQQREDAAQAQNVRVIDACFRTDLPNLKQLNFEQPADGVALLTPYDVGSIMQYPSYSGSVDADHAKYTGACPPTTSEKVNTCPTELFLEPEHPNDFYCTDHGWERGTYHDTFPLGLSPEDINGFAQLYEQPPIDGCVTSGQLGSEMAAGDLDGDGYADLAVSIANTVRLYKGTVNGLVFWETLRVSAFAGSSPSTGDQFGATLAIGKLAGANTSGTDHVGAELFVGAPGYNHGAGAVFVWQPASARPGVENGTTTKPTTEMVKLRRIDPPTATQRGFGRALALGNYTAADQLAVSSLDAAGEGVVDVMAWNGTSNFTKAFGVATPRPGTRDGFGLALAAGDLDGAGRNELAVGAPFATVQGDNDGAVYIFGIAGDFMTSKQVFEASPAHLVDRFGAALKIGHRLAGAADTLVVGAPGAGAGRVVTFQWDAGLGKLTNRGSESGANVGDQFGIALRLADEDGDGLADLFIGAPGAANGHGTVTIDRTRKPDVITKVGDNNDLGFGAAIAIGNFDGTGTAVDNSTDATPDLAVGAPQSSCGANVTDGGAVTYFKNLPGNHILDKRRRFAPLGASPASVVP